MPNWWTSTDKTLHLKMPLIMLIFNPSPKARKEKKEVEDPPKKIVEKWMIILKIHKYEGHQDMILQKYKNHIQQQYFREIKIN